MTLIRNAASDGATQRRMNLRTTNADALSGGSLNVMVVVAFHRRNSSKGRARGCYFARFCSAPQTLSIDGPAAYSAGRATIVSKAAVELYGMRRNDGVPS